MKRPFDLHVHSAASDGLLEPQALAAHAVGAGVGVGVICLCDHDTTAGIELCQAQGVQVIPGVELSCRYDGCEVHILGHGVDPSSEELAGYLRRQREQRQTRNEEMLRRLQRLGIELPEVYRPEQGGDSYGRAHMARGIVALGRAQDVDDAFGRYVGRNGAAYVPRAETPPEDAIACLLRCGAYPGLAHPFQTGLAGEKLRSFVGCLAHAGLRALEAYYWAHTPAQEQFCLELCGEFDLYPTYGSDFHGDAGHGELAQGWRESFDDKAWAYLALLGAHGGEG